MVDVEGNEAKLCVCPLCGEWQKYIARLYARYAELEPSILWVEDDLPSANHEPLAWGGAFVTSIEAVQRPRGQAADAGRISGRRAASRRAASLSEDMAGCDPRDDAQRRRSHRTGGARCVKAGEGGPHELGSAHPRPPRGATGMHCCTRLRPDARLWTRVHLPGYQENSPSNYLHGFNMVSMLTRAMLPSETEVYPELENFPFSLFSKSRRFTRFQLLSALPLDLAASPLTCMTSTATASFGRMAISRCCTVQSPI